MLDFSAFLLSLGLGPLIALGNKKTLDLEDVPQLDPSDSVVGAFQILEISLRQSVVQLIE
jgi:hypothetical protein